MDYSEGAKVGYKWYEAEKKPVLFPFGYGLVVYELQIFGAEGECGWGVR